jgi:hypothetical protein
MCSSVVWFVLGERDPTFEKYQQAGEDVQDEVDVVAKERAHDKRKCATGNGEQKDMHGDNFVLKRRGKVRRRYRSRVQLDTYDLKRVYKRKAEPADAYHGDVYR